MTLVDTSSWIHFLRRNGDQVVKRRVRHLLDQGTAVLCPIVAVELWMGAKSGKDREDVSQIVRVLRMIEINSEVWRRADQLAQACCSNGTPVPSSDLIIAACAFTQHADIEAVDRHYEALQAYRILPASPPPQRP